MKRDYLIMRDGNPFLVLVYQDADGNRWATEEEPGDVKALPHPIEDPREIAFVDFLFGTAPTTTLRCLYRDPGKPTDAAACLFVGLNP